MKYLILLVLIFVIYSCQDDSKVSDQVVAQIDTRTVTLKEFRLFYELDPNFGIDSSGYSTLLDELGFYISQICALQKAKEEGFVNDPIFIRAVQWEERQAMLRELFRQDILNQVEIDESDLRKAFLNTETTVRVRHLFSQDLETIKEYEQRITGGEPYAKLAAECFEDTNLVRRAGDLGWIKLADLEDEFASGIVDIKDPDSLQIVKSKWGYHLVEVLDRRMPVIVNESKFVAEREKLEKKIRQKRAIQKSQSYVKERLMALNPQPNERIFQLLWMIIIPSEQQENDKLEHPVMFSNFLIEKCNTELTNVLAQPFITFADGQISLGDFLKYLHEIPSGQRLRFKSARQLSDQLAIWMRDHVLFQEAKKRGLDNNERVQKEVRRFREEQVYNYYLKKVLDDLTLDSTIVDYYKLGKKGGHVRQKELGKFHTLQEWEWHLASHILRVDLSSCAKQAKINYELLKQENERINWDRRIRMFMARKPHK